MRSTRPLCLLSCVLGLAQLVGGPRALAETAVRPIVFEVGDTKVRVLEHLNDHGSKLVYFAPHDSEKTCVQACDPLIDQQGGRILELKSGGRNVTVSVEGQKVEFDPNRIFTETGVRKTLANLNKKVPAGAAKAVGQFGEKLLSEIGKRQPIVAIHNNTNEGGLQITGYKKGSAEAADVFRNPKLDTDDFFLVTDDKHFELFKNAGYNVVLQNNGAVGDDGSLSVYCGQHHLDYVNVEAQLGHRAQQARMLEAVLALSNKQPLPPPVP